MREQAAAGFKAVEFVQISVGQDRCELQNLVERGVRAGGFGIVEDEPHLDLPALLHGASALEAIVPTDQLTVRLRKAEHSEPSNLAGA
jgi:hypothetical protein